MFTYVLLAVVAMVVVLFLIAGVKIVRPYERGIVERLGKYKETKESGLQIIVPFIDTSNGLTCESKSLMFRPRK